MTDINQMMHEATASICAMQNRMVVLEESLLQAKHENDGLRENNARITEDALHAVADLKHFQNVFKAQACVTAMEMCNKFFEIAHERMKEEASDAVKKIVEEAQAKQKEERKVQIVKDHMEVDDEFEASIIEAHRDEHDREYDRNKTVDYDRMDVEEGRIIDGRMSPRMEKALEEGEKFDRSLDEFRSEVSKIQAPNTGVAPAPIYVQANPAWSNQQKKSYYYKFLKQVPDGYKDCPKINRITLERVVDLDLLKNQDEIPQFLKQPITPMPTSRLRDTVASMATSLGM